MCPVCAESFLVRWYEKTAISQDLMNLCTECSHLQCERKCAALFCGFGFFPSSSRSFHQFELGLGRLVNLCNHSPISSLIFMRTHTQTYIKSFRSSQLKYSNLKSLSNFMRYTNQMCSQPTVKRPTGQPSNIAIVCFCIRIGQFYPSSNQRFEHIHILEIRIQSNRVMESVASMNVKHRVHSFTLLTIGHFMRFYMGV